MTNFNIGDLVEVLDGTHQQELPDNRTGIIIQQNDGLYDMPEEGVGINVWYVHFTNGCILKFHEMFLRKIVE